MAEIRYFASIAEAAGTREETRELPAEPTVGALREALTEGRGEDFARLIAMSAMLVNGVSSADTDEIAEPARIDILPPFAGG